MDDLIARLTARALSGNSNAQFELGAMHQMGDSVEKNEKLGVHWIRRAADSGHPLAQCGLAVCLEAGEGVPQDLEAAMGLYCSAAAKGVAFAQQKVASHYLNEGKVTEAMELYEKAAYQGNTRSQSILGISYANGANGYEKDYVKAVKWLMRAADQGDADALNDLGVFHSHGYGVRRDLKQASMFYSRSANLGNPSAMYNYACMLETGDGVPMQDKRLAAHYYKMASERGDEDATYALKSLRDMHIADDNHDIDPHSDEKSAFQIFFRSESPARDRYDPISTGAICRH